MIDTDHELIQCYLAGIASNAESRELAERLKQDDALLRLYVSYANLDVALEAQALVRAESPGLRAPPSRRRMALRWLAATAALVACCATLASWWTNQGTAIEVVSISDNPATAWRPGDRLRMRRLAWDRGRFQLRFDSGVLLGIDAPAQLEFVSPMEIVVVSGKVTVDAGEHGKGFVIQTPETRITDLGTRFGVDASNKGHTDVLVFEGRVDVQLNDAPANVERLNAGQGMRISRHQRTSRIISVIGSDDFGSWNTEAGNSSLGVISVVGDSMATNDEGVKKWPSLRSFYHIVPRGLHDGATSFADEFDQWSAVPAPLQGADLVRTFSADGFNWWMQMSVTVRQPCAVFVFVDARNAAPSWLSQGFEDTGEKLMLDCKNRNPPHQLVRSLEFSVWKKTVLHPGEVKLGPPYPNPPDDKKNFRPNRMYGVAAKALP